MSDIEQLDLTEHVFRSVRGWLHRLLPEPHTILIERRRDTAPTAEPKPIWNLDLAAGPNWAEHTGGSSMVSYVIKITRVTADRMEAMRAAGRITANATRPAGRIPLRGYNLPWPQQPSIVAGAPATTAWPAAQLDLAVVSLGADGPESAPSARVTVAPADGTPILVIPSAWPYGAGSVAVYAAEVGEPLQLQGEAGAGDIFVLTTVEAGSTPPSNVSCPLPGLRITSAEGEATQLRTDGDPAFQAVVQLGLTVQVPRLLPAHLDAALAP